MATIDLGKIKQVFRGTYNNATAYVPDDLVVFTDTGITSTYICTTASTGNNPSSGGTAHANWAYIAKGVTDPIPSQSGNAGKVLKTDGSSLSFDDADAGLQSMNVYSTAGSHTWTKPTGIKKIKVYVTGAGGGGMSGPSNDNNGSCGGAGGTAIKIIDVTSISSVAVTVGAGGAGVSGSTSSARNGNAGGASSFGSHCSATGGGAGRGGTDDSYGGEGGIGSGGDLNLRGTCGHIGGTDGSSNPNPPVPQPPGSFWGGGGRMGKTDAGLSNTNCNGFHGGAGGMQTEGDAAGAGGPGIVVVENYK